MPRGNPLSDAKFNTLSCSEFILVGVDGVERGRLMSLNPSGALFTLTPNQYGSGSPECYVALLEDSVWCRFTTAQEIVELKTVDGKLQVTHTIKEQT